MAIKNTKTNEYMRVLFDADNPMRRLNMVLVKIYADYQQRQREKTGQLTQYETTRQEFINVEDALITEIERPAAGGPSLQDDILSAMYVAVKAAREAGLADKIVDFTEDA